MAKTIVSELELRIADDFLIQTAFKNVGYVPLVSDSVLSQNLTLQTNISVTLSGSASAQVTYIVAAQPIRVSMILNGSQVQFPTSIAPIVVPGSATQIILVSDNSSPTDVYVLQGV